MTQEIHETDLQPVKNQNGHVCPFSTTEVIHWHNAAVQFGKIAVLCAAKAGAELNAIKGQCQHGEWKEVVKSLPFGEKTAQRYRALADEMQARLMELGYELDLEALPEPQYLADPENAELIEKIHEVTSEQSLRQLYFDWGIMRKPTPIEPALEPALKPGETLLGRDAERGMGELQKMLFDHCVEASTSLLPYLEPHKLKMFLDTVILTKNAIEDQIKAG